MGLVSEWKRGGSNTIKAGDRVVKCSERVCERSRSGGREEAVLQQESVVAVEIHDDLERDVGFRWLPTLPLPFSGVEFIVAVVLVGLRATRESFSETLEWAEDREVGKETFRWWIAGRSQRNIAKHGWQDLLRIEPSLKPSGVVPAHFFNIIQVNADGEGGRRLLERGRLPIRTPTGQ